MPLDPPPTTGRFVVRGACPHDCPDTCAHARDGRERRAIAVRGDPDDPFTDGTLCTKVAKYLDRTYSTDRVLHPMRRVGRKGEGRFERITWDEALDEIAARFAEIAEGTREAILPYSYAGTMGQLQYASMDRRFFHRLGAQPARPHDLLVGRQGGLARSRSADRSAWTRSASTRRSSS